MENFYYLKGYLANSYIVWLNTLREAAGAIHALMDGWHAGNVELEPLPSEFHKAAFKVMEAELEVRYFHDAAKFHLILCELQFHPGVPYRAMKLFF